jgi:hypothetical protein
MIIAPLGFLAIYLVGIPIAASVIYGTDAETDGAVACITGAAWPIVVFIFFIAGLSRLAKKAFE